MDSTRARNDHGSRNHHHDRAAVRAFFAARDFDWWADRRMSVAVLFAAAIWAGSAPSNRDQVDRAPARNTVCIQTLLRCERMVGRGEEAEVFGIFDPLFAPATTPVSQVQHLRLADGVGE